MDVSDFLLTQAGSFQDLYKTNILAGRTLHTTDKRETFNNFRREARKDLLFQKRNIDDNLTPLNTPEPTKKVTKMDDKKKNVNEGVNKRFEMLTKWKAEKETRKLAEKLKSKPIFKVTHVPAEIGLPNWEIINKTIKGKPIKQEKTFKSQFAPKNHKFTAPKNIQPIEMGKDVTKPPQKLRNTGKPTSIINSRRGTLRSANIENKVENVDIKLATSRKLLNKKDVKKLTGTESQQNGKPIPQKQRIVKESSSKKICNQKIGSKTEKPAVKKETENASQQPQNIPSLSNEIVNMTSTSKEIPMKPTRRVSRKNALKDESNMETEIPEITLQSDSKEENKVTPNISQFTPKKALNNKRKLVKTPRKDVDSDVKITKNNQVERKSAASSSSNTGTQQNNSKVSKDKVTFKTLQNTPQEAKNKRKFVKTPRKNMEPFVEIIKDTSSQVEWESSSSSNAEDTLQNSSKVQKDEVSFKTPQKTPKKAQNNKNKKTPRKNVESEVEITKDTSSQVDCKNGASSSSNADTLFKTPQKTPKKAQNNKKLVKTPTKNLDSDIEATIEDKTPVEYKSHKKNKANSSLNSSYSASPDYPLISIGTDTSGDTFHSVKPTTAELAKTPVYISPFVTVSRGKNSARKEFHNRTSTTLNSSTHIEDFNQSTSPSAGADYFTVKLNNEIVRIEELCEGWTEYKNKNNLPPEADDLIDVFTGQANLLINNKFQQFRKLIEECRSSRFVEKPVTCEDLHGFWDMIFMQVENLNKRMDNLNALKDNHWEEIVTVKKTVVPVKKPRGRPKKTTKATSTLAEIIKMERNKKKNKNFLQAPQTEDQKLFDGGYFSVQSPIKLRSSTSAINSPANKSTKKSLCVSVLTTEASKRTSITLMRVSQAIKCGDGITPGRSILKNDLTRSVGRITKSVLFKDDIDSDEFTQNKENDFNNVNVTPRRSSRISKVVF